MKGASAHAEVGCPVGQIEKCGLKGFVPFHSAHNLLEVTERFKSPMVETEMRVRIELYFAGVGEGEINIASGDFVAIKNPRFRILCSVLRNVFSNHFVPHVDDLGSEYFVAVRLEPFFRNAAVCHFPIMREAWGGSMLSIALQRDRESMRPSFRRI